MKNKTSIISESIDMNDIEIATKSTFSQIFGKGKYDPFKEDSKKFVKI